MTASAPMRQPCEQRVSWITEQHFVSCAKYQNTIEGWRVSSALNVTQDSDSRVLCQLIDDNLLNHFSGNWISFPINCAFRYDDDVQTLAWWTLLNGVEKLRKFRKTFSWEGVKRKVWKHLKMTWWWIVESLTTSNELCGWSHNTQWVRKTINRTSNVVHFVKMSTTFKYYKKRRRFWEFVKLFTSKQVILPLKYKNSQKFLIFSFQLSAVHLKLVWDASPISLLPS